MQFLFVGPAVSFGFLPTTPRDVAVAVRLGVPTTRGPQRTFTSKSLPGSLSLAGSKRRSRRFAPCLADQKRRAVLLSQHRPSADPFSAIAGSRRRAGYGPHESIVHSLNLASRQAAGLEAGVFFGQKPSGPRVSLQICCAWQLFSNAMHA